MAKKHPQVDEFLKTAGPWQQELKALRIILLEAGLTEQWKWRQPCYSFDGHNVAILGTLKDKTTSLAAGSQLPRVVGKLLALSRSIPPAAAIQRTERNPALLKRAG